MWPAIVGLIVMGRSMHPTFTSGDTVLAYSLQSIDVLERNDIVAIRCRCGAIGADDTISVKRITRLPGEAIPMDLIAQKGAGVGSAVVLPGHYYVEGNWKSVSRYFGQIPREWIRAKVDTTTIRKWRR